jgi:hypothetical protein
MNVPGFTAEASLGRAPSHFWGNVVSCNSAAVEILPMQEFTSAPTASGSRLWPPPWMKRVPCCISLFGRPYCTYSYVPVWYQCDVIYNPYACWICRPPVFEASTS